MSDKTNINRRQFIKATVATGAVSVSDFAPPALSQKLHDAERNSNKIKLKFGVINDVHHTITEHDLGPDIGEHSEWIKALRKR